MNRRVFKGLLFLFPLDVQIGQNGHHRDTSPGSATRRWSMRRDNLRSGPSFPPGPCGTGGELVGRTPLQFLTDQVIVIMWDPVGVLRRSSRLMLLFPVSGCSSEIADLESKRELLEKYTTRLLVVRDKRERERLELAGSLSWYRCSVRIVVAVVCVVTVGGLSCWCVRVARTDQSSFHSSSSHLLRSNTCPRNSILRLGNSS